MDALRDPASSLFEFVNELNKGHVFPNSRRSLEVMSHEIETAVTEGNIRARMFAGFQYMRYFMPHVRHYQEIARTAECIWVFGVQDVEPPPIPNVIYVPLAENDRLAQEWFVVVDSPEYFSALAAQDLSGSPFAAHGSSYRGIWTFEPEIIRQADKWLSRAVGVVEADIDLTGRNYSQQLFSIGHTVESLINNLELRNAELERIQALTRTLTDMIVHDINNPLTAVVSSLNLIERTVARGEFGGIPRYTKAGKESAQEALGLIRDLLDVSRMEAGEFKIDIAPVLISDLVKPIIDHFDAMAQIQDKRLTAELAPNLRVNGDQGLLVRVLTNLVGNAFKFTPAGGQIIISAQPGPDAESVTVSVTDNGMGIAKHQQKRIFEKFGQVQGRSTDKYGFGLGLTFCRMCVEAHGGRISVESDEGKGASFRFTLPVALVEELPRRE